jgi:pantetheine-phosphate adenylyltransferase
MKVDFTDNISFSQEYFPIEIVSDIIEKYSEPWREYHTLTHILDLFDKFRVMHEKGKINDADFDVLKLATLFHDVIYFPWNVKIGDDYVLGKSNEELSAEYFENAWVKTGRYKSDLFYLVRDIILNTETHKIENDIQRIFMKEDTSILYKNNWNDVLNWEKAIRKEFNIASTKDYKKGRIDFLNKVLIHHDENPCLYDLKNYVKEYKPRVAFYAGSFNPFHIGHLDIVNQAKKMFDKVVILLGQNPNKEPLTSEEIEKRTKNIFKKTTCEVVFVDGLLVDYLEKREAEGDEEVFLIKGFRDSKDIAYEQTNDRFSNEFYPELRTVYLPSKPELTHVSSSAIKALKLIDKKKAKKYIPKNLF